jgi:hypothetical protein
MKLEPKLIYELRRYPVIELEELFEAVRLEIKRREIEPFKYEVAALRQKMSELEQHYENNNPR